MCLFNWRQLRIEACASLYKYVGVVLVSDPQPVYTIYNTTQYVATKMANNTNTMKKLDM